MSCARHGANRSAHSPELPALLISNRRQSATIAPPSRHRKPSPSSRGTYHRNQQRLYRPTTCTYKASPNPIQSASDRRHMTCAIVHAMELTAFGRVHRKRRDWHGPRPGEHLAVPRGNAIAPQAKRRRSCRHARPCARYRPRTQAPRRTSGRRDTPLARLHDCGRSAERLCHTHIYHSRPRHGMLPETGMAPNRPPLCAA